MQALRVKTRNASSLKMISLKITLIILFFLFFAPSRSACQIVKTISLEFTRSTKNRTQVDTASGEIYYDGHKTILRISKPISQWMVLEGNKMLLYYPEEQRALEFISQNPARLPFFQGFVGAMQEDFGLSELGFKLEKSSVHEDTLFVYWSPPKNTQKYIGPTILALKDNKIVYAKIKDNGGETITMTSFRNHFKHGGTYFPLHVTSVQHTESDTIIEEIIYSNPVFDEPIPEYVANFKIPANIKIEKISW